MPPLQQERVTFQSLAAGRPSFELDFVRVAAPEKTQVDNPSQTDVWAYMWGCSVLLAEVLCHAGVRNLRVLEVGAGLGAHGYLPACSCGVSACG